MLLDCSSNGTFVNGERAQSPGPGHDAAHGRPRVARPLRHAPH